MDKLSQIALTFTPGLGPTSIRRLVETYPDEDIFSLPPSELKAAFGNHHNTAEAIIHKSAFPRAEEEMLFMQQHDIRGLFFTDPDFPQRLNNPETYDCPALLYVKGDLDLNRQRAVAVVGTRRATQHGRDTADRLIQQLTPLEPTIVSGLAYGIDTAAHNGALTHGLPTAAVLAHGLDRIYPTQNRQLAVQILQQGGALVTEYPSQTVINPTLFPARNRIIAAMADATVVVEATEKGGALITAAMAASYQRDVFAVPGRPTDTYSAGTNNLIATNRAVLVRNADDIAYHLGWPLQKPTAVAQQSLFPALTPAEQKTVDLLKSHSHLTLDEIVSLTGMPLPKAASIIFNLEMQKVIRVLPGHLYESIV